MGNEVKITFTGEPSDLLEKSERINRKLDEIGRLAESAGQKIDKNFAATLANLDERNLAKIADTMRDVTREGEKANLVLERLKAASKISPISPGDPSRFLLGTSSFAGSAGPADRALLGRFDSAAKVLGETEGAVTRVAKASAEGTKQVGALASIFTATTENGRKMRAVLYDVANQAGLPGVARGLGVFGGSPVALIGGFAFLEVARSASHASGEILKANQAALKFEETMANFGNRGGAKQIQGEVDKLIEARNAMAEVAALGGTLKEQIEELNKAGIRRPAEKPSLFKTILAAGLEVGGGLGSLVPAPQGPLGIQNQQELEQLIRAGNERFLKSQRLSDQAGSETIFSKAREGLGLEVPKRIPEIDELNKKLADLEINFKKDAESADRFQQKFKLLQDLGKDIPENIASARLEELNRYAQSVEFLNEADRRGVSAAELYAEKVRAIGKEAAAAKTQLQEFNRSGQDFATNAERLEKLKAGSDIALKQLSRGLDKDNPFAFMFDQAELRIDQFKKQFGDLGQDVIDKAEEINQKLTRLDFFKASLDSIGRVVQMQERLKQLTEGHEYEDAERKRKLEFGERQASLETEIRELQRGSRFSEIEKAAETVRRLVQTPGLNGAELSKAVEEATRGLSIEQLRAGGLLHTRQDALADIARSERTAEAFRKDPAEVRETREFIAKAQAEFAASVERAKVDKGFAQTFDQGRSQEILDREIIAFTSRISPDKLTPDLREKERDATQRQIERDAQDRQQAQAMINQFGESVSKFDGSVAGMKKPIIDFITALAKGIGIGVSIKDSPTTRSEVTGSEPSPFNSGGFATAGGKLDNDF